MDQRLLTLGVVVALLGGAFVYTTAGAKDDLENAASGVAAQLTVHTAIITEGGISPASAEYVEPNALQAASLAPKSLSFAPPPLSMSCTATRPLSVSTSPAPGNVPPPTLSIRFRVVETDGRPAVGAAITRYQIRSDGDAVYQGPIGTVDAAGTLSYTASVQSGDVYNFVAQSEGGCAAGASGRFIVTGAPSVPPPQAAPITTPSPSEAWVPVTLTGKLSTKNIAGEVTLIVQYSLYTAGAAARGGNAIGHEQRVTVKPSDICGRVPQLDEICEGALRSISHTFKGLALGDLHGRNTVTIKVTAAATDQSGRAVEQAQSLTVTKSVDASGSVTVDMRAASLVSTTIGPNGQPRTREAFRVPQRR